MIAIEQTIPDMISVIVPVFNREKTLRRCVDSILSSTYENIELILVDDGSTDTSWAIIQSYQDQRIKAYHTPNRGVSSARNTGLAYASGEYVCFVDSDDYITQDIYRSCQDIIKKHHPDMLMFNHGVYFERSANGFDSQPLKIPQNVLLDRAYIVNTILPVLLNLNDEKGFFIENFIWNKLYRRSLLYAHQILFDMERKRWEDRIFQIFFLRYAQTFYYTSEIGYYYVLGNSSFSQVYDPTVFDFILSARSDYMRVLGEDLAKKYNFDSDFSASYYCRTINNTIFLQFDIPDLCEDTHKADITAMLRSEEAQILYARFQPKTPFEIQLKSFLTTGKIDAAYALYQSEYQKQQAEKVRQAKKNTFISRLLNKIRRILSISS